ncbi:hypothetical protein E1297_09440 [Roseibium sp. RKSG952]|nr:hypothetical protein [Roseibium sp. RKSG952]
MTEQTLSDTHDRLRTQLLPRPGATLVIVFSQVRVPAGKFGLSRLFERTRHACLFLNDPGNGWYLGLDDRIDAAVTSAIARTNPERIIYYGSSMGGYGALATGLRRRDGTIYAFGPELDLGRPGSQSAASGIPEAALSIQVLSGPHPYPVHCFFGICDPVDAQNAVLAQERLTGACMHTLWSSHASHDHLYSLNIIRRLTRTFDRDPAAELGSKQLIAALDPAPLAQFGLLGERLAAGHRIAPDDLQHLPGYPENPGMMMLAARAAGRNGDLQGALSIAEQAERLIADTPVLHTLPKRWRKQLPLFRIENLIALNRLNDARTLLLETVRRFPEDAKMRDLAATLRLELAPEINPAG